MKRSFLLRIGIVAILTLVFAVPAAADHDPDDGGNDGGEDSELHLTDPSAPLHALDSAGADVVSSGPFGKVVKNVALRGRGERLLTDATTDVWAHEGYAYTGTFGSPCGGEPGGGVHIWDVSNHNKVSFVGVIPSPTGSRSNDVKVASMNSGDILVHSNERCAAGGLGGFEIYNVDDPENPVFLAHVGPINELNPVSDALFGGITDVGVHNVFLFTQGSNDYVAAVSESAFDNFRVWDITDPTAPALVSAWGAEEIFDPGVGDSTEFTRVLNAALWLIDGFGDSSNRFLHDITISADGTKAYLSNWDAGLVLLDISDPSDPQLVSVALDLAGSLDGEVNSHAAWPSEDGSIVVETEEDFDAWQESAPPGNLTMDSPFPGDPTIPGTAISTLSGNDFEANQTGNIGTVDGSSVSVASGPLAGNSYAAIELATASGSPTFATTGPLTGELVWVGQACAADPILNAGAFDPGDIAVVRRGVCFFEEKAATAASIGASAVIISNNVVGETPWSGVRIWDYSDPSNPVLASTFNTECSASPTLLPSCSAFGTYSVHNVIVESTGNKTYAYLSWYWDGMVILDVTDPYNPVETGRFFDSSPELLAENGGNPHDFWGVYKITNAPWIYGSDRNGGLYIFKEQGSGSGK